jgi:hypothetical protein
MLLDEQRSFFIQLSITIIKRLDRLGAILANRTQDIIKDLVRRVRVGIEGQGSLYRSQDVRRRTRDIADDCTHNLPPTALSEPQLAWLAVAAFNSHLRLRRNAGARFFLLGARLLQRVL